MNLVERLGQEIRMLRRHVYRTRRSRFNQLKNDVRAAAYSGKNVDLDKVVFNHTPWKSEFRHARQFAFTAHQLYSMEANRIKQDGKDILNDVGDMVLVAGACAAGIVSMVDGYEENGILGSVKGFVSTTFFIGYKEDLKAAAIHYTNLFRDRVLKVNEPADIYNPDSLLEKTLTQIKLAEQTSGIYR
jgi:hypothetical protein